MVNGSQIYLVYGSESDIKRYHGWNDIQISKVKDVQHMEDKVKKQRTQKTPKKKNQHSNWKQTLFSKNGSLDLRPENQ